MNRPNPENSVVVPRGERKVKLFKDEKIANAATFVFMREDHTLGNILRMQLLEDKDVLFAGYKMPHPLVNDLSLRVQTSKHKDPVAAVTDSLSELSQTAQLMKDDFERALSDPSSRRR